MLLNFFKITLRNFRKNKFYVAINLIGLGLSLACCIVGYLNYKYAVDFDTNHVNAHRVYKIQSYKEVQDKKVPVGVTPLPLGNQIKGSYSGISHYSRYSGASLVLKKDLKVFDKWIGFAEDDFLEIFTMPLKYGNKSALLDRSKIILSLETSETYFGDSDPIGEIIYMITPDGEQIPMTVGGVFGKIPSNSSISFAGLTHFDNFLKVKEFKPDDWKHYIAATFVMSESGAYPQNLLDDINTNFITIQNEARQDFKFSEYYAISLSNLGQHVIDMPYNWLGEPISSIEANVPFIMAILLLLIACFNFTNTSIAISSKRLKEIGVRKVMGSSRKQLIFQFMGENLLLSFLAILVAVCLSYYLVPLYDALWKMGLKLDLTSNLEIYGFLIVLLIFTSIIAGGYPSLYISGYQPVKILRGNLSLGGTNIFSKVLLGAQYMLTVIGLISSLAFAKNATYQSNADIGFSKENILSVRVESETEYQGFYNEVMAMPEVDEILPCTNHIGWWYYIRNLKSETREIEADLMNLNLGYDKLMDLKIVKGRYFDPKLYEYDRFNAIVVNEVFVEEMGWSEPIGKVLQLNDTTRLNVIGVMKNFYMHGFFDPVNPSGFRLGAKEDVNFVVIKSGLKPTELYEKMEAKWYEVAPNSPFDARFQSEVISNAIETNENVVKMFLFLGIVALILSGIGLYTLVSLNVIKRIKEIGVRKVLGASIQQIILLFNKQFVILMVIATSIGAGLAFYLIDGLMTSVFSLYKEIDYFTIVLPFAFLVFMALFLASLRIFFAAIQNPMKSLRYE